MFKGDQRVDIQDKAVDVLIEFGQHVGGLEAIRIKVGDLILILDDVHTSVEMANVTDFRGKSIGESFWYFKAKSIGENAF